MNSNIEEEIVDSYYQKRCRERIKWELKTPRRRDDGIWKMRLKKYLDEDKMHHLEYLSIEQLKKKILKLGGKETAYLFQYILSEKLILLKESKRHAMMIWDVFYILEMV